jgi:DNA-binding MarR family transcriptional regulator
VATSIVWRYESSSATRYEGSPGGLSRGGRILGDAPCHGSAKPRAGATPLLKAEQLSPTQYNVLRILRGALDGLPCGEIGQRMITRDPDITRLLDRLEKRGLIARWRDSKDRRMVLARITPEGLKMLARLDGPMQERHRKQLGHLGRERLMALCELLRVARREP